MFKMVTKNNTSFVHIMKLPSSTEKVPNATTVIPITLNISKQDFDIIIETFSDIKSWLMIIAIIIVLSRLIKSCKRAYSMHNENVIRRHNKTTSQI